MTSAVKAPTTTRRRVEILVCDLLLGRPTLFGVPGIPRSSRPEGASSRFGKPARGRPILGASRVVLPFPSPAGFGAKAPISGDQYAAANWNARGGKSRTDTADAAEAIRKSVSRPATQRGRDHIAAFTNLLPAPNITPSSALLAPVYRSRIASR